MSKRVVVPRESYLVQAMATPAEDGLEEAARRNNLAGAIRYHHEKSESSENTRWYRANASLKAIAFGRVFCWLSFAELTCCSSLLLYIIYFRECLNDAK